MFYSYEITVTAALTEANASETIGKLTHGVITRVSFRPRPGHCGLCHRQVFYHEHQIAPTNRGEDLHGDEFPIEWNEFEKLDSAPYDLKIKAWNDDDAYPHTFDISFALFPEWVAIPVSIAQVIKDVLQALIPKRIWSKEK